LALPSFINGAILKSALLAWGLSLAVIGVKAYHSGASSTEARWQAKMSSLEADLHAKHSAELFRIQEANDYAVLQAGATIVELEASITELEGAVALAAEEAKVDPKTNDIGISHSSAKRIGRIK
jgi:hypothetical protein